MAKKREPFPSTSPVSAAYWWLLDRAESVDGSRHVGPHADAARILRSIEHWLLTNAPEKVAKLHAAAARLGFDDAPKGRPKTPRKRTADTMLKIIERAREKRTGDGIEGALRVAASTFTGLGLKSPPSPARIEKACPSTASAEAIVRTIFRLADDKDPDNLFAAERVARRRNK